MKPKDEKRFAELMAALGECFDKIPSAAKIEIYFRALEDLSIDQISQGCSEILKTRKITGTFPLVAEIRDAALGNIDEDTLALAAWAKVDWAIDYIGHGQSIAFDDPEIMKAIILWAGSWRKIQEMDWSYEGYTWRKKEFISSYKAAKRCEVKPPEYFMGEFELNNEHLGYHEFIKPPYLVCGIPGEFYYLKGPGPKQLPKPKSPNLLREIEHKSS